MSATLLLHAGNVKVLIGHHKVSPHLLQGLVRDSIDPQLPLALSQPEPELAPGRVPRSLAEELRHGGAAVAGGESGLVAVVWRAARRGGWGRHGEVFASQKLTRNWLEVVVRGVRRGEKERSAGKIFFVRCAARLSESAREPQFYGR
jgi:hypothetical protein